MDFWANFVVCICGGSTWIPAWIWYYTWTYVPTILIFCLTKAILCFLAVRQGQLAFTSKTPGAVGLHAQHPNLECHQQQGQPDGIVARSLPKILEH